MHSREEQLSVSGFTFGGERRSGFNIIRRREVMAEFERITFDKQIMGGRACIRGMRTPVSVVVSQITQGATFDKS